MVIAIGFLLALQTVSGWNLWTRDSNVGTLTEEGNVFRVEHRGEQDWSATRNNGSMDVKSGDIMQITCHIRKEGSGSTGPCFIAYRPDGSAFDWSLGYNDSATSKDQLIKATAVVPKGVTRLMPRVIGWGKATVWFSGFKVSVTGNIEQLRPKNLKSQVSLQSTSLKLSFNTELATFTLFDKRSKKLWEQFPVDPTMIVLNATQDKTLDVDLLDVRTMTRYKMAAELDKKEPEVRCSLRGDGAMPKEIVYPAPFTAQVGTDLIVPMNEGVSFPVDDPEAPEMQLVGYGGHGICMSFWGVTDSKTALMTLIDTPDDFALKLQRREKLLEGHTVWQSQKGQFGYDRKWRWIAFDKGGYVAMTKRYRHHAREQGRLVTLKEKRKAVPAIDLLVGAPNLWCFGGDGMKVLNDFKTADVQRILWSAAGSPDFLKKVNDMGYLSSRYDIYQDVMDPVNYAKIQYTHPDWPKEAWPKDIVIKSDGKWEHGWEIEAKDGGWYPCGVVCDKQAIAYADKRIANELETHPYKCRFIDTTTASAWRECYSLDHPMTRTESRKYKMDLLKLISDHFKLVTGSETGHDAAVPYASYFEGMLSLGPFRTEDAGRHMEKTVDPAPYQITKFQVGERYRLPLWELVYHDCLCAHWYWGDHQGKVPSVWDKRDLFNILYGTAPLFLFNGGDWEKLKPRILKSCTDILPVARATGYSEMTEHRYLTKDRTVQQSRFANGIVVTVNFRKQAYSGIKPMGFKVIAPSQTTRN